MRAAWRYRRLSQEPISLARTIARLRADGVIPAGLRFQIGLPFPASALNAFKADFAHDYPIAARGFEDLAARELRRRLRRSTFRSRRRRAIWAHRLGPAFGR